MGFSIVEQATPIKSTWYSTDGSSSYYIGQIVTFVAASKAVVTAGAVKPLAVPAGAADTTNFQVIAGIVTGLNKYRQPSLSSYGQYDTGVLTQAAQSLRDFRGAGGMYSKGDSQTLVEVTRITPDTLIEGPICNAALGTAPTVVYDTAGTDTTGYTSAGTTGACDFTPAASLCTMYCRSGINAGLYRVTSDVSTTAPVCTIGFPNDVVLADSFVRVPLKQGLSYIYIGGSDVPGMYINCGQPPATNYFIVMCEKVNLKRAGEETAQFRFSTCHFDPARA